MRTPKAHYEKLLSKYYDWMFGDSFDEKVAEQYDLLVRAGLRQPGLVVDLGCGSGFQSFAVLRLGASNVVSVDTSEDLLQSLDSRVTTEAIQTVCADLLNVRDIVKDPVDSILCMGDTLTHLANVDQIQQLLVDVYAQLAPGGRFVVSYRDLSAMPEGVDRFIPVRSTKDTIMTCFLEANGTTVIVHDLIQTREGAGWNMEISAYPKLIIHIDELKSKAIEAGFSIEKHFVERGMQVLTAVRV